jgi:hypothetical protein
MKKYQAVCPEWRSECVRTHLQPVIETVTFTTRGVSVHPRFWGRFLRRMTLTLSQIDHGDLCHGWSWVVQDEEKLAQQVARVALGQFRHVSTHKAT